MKIRATFTIFQNMILHNKNKYILRNKKRIIIKKKYLTFLNLNCKLNYGAFQYKKLVYENKNKSYI